MCRVELLTPAETAKILRVRQRTLADWRYRGVGPKYVRYGGKTVLYRREEIERFLDDRQVQSTAEESVTGKAA